MGAYGAPQPPPGRAGLSVGDAISYGWNAFTRNVGPLMVIALVVVGISIAVSLLASLLGNAIDSWFVRQVLVQLPVTLVMMLLGFGLIKAALAIVDGRSPQVAMLFDGENFGPYIIAAILVNIGVTVGLILCIIPGMIVAFLWQFFGYAIADRDTVGATESMKRSWTLVSANVGDLILLYLAAIGINIVGALLCGVGLLVSVPVTGIAYAYAWRRIIGGPVAAQV